MVNEFKIKCSTPSISESLLSAMLDVGKELTSVDVQSLYTNEALRIYRRRYKVTFLRDDILRDIKKLHIKTKQDKINLLNSALIFTCELENNGLY